MKKCIEMDGFDFHCHVDLHPDPVAVVAECEKRKVGVLAVTTTPRAWSQNCVWTLNSNFVHACIGLHPELVKDRYHEVERLEETIGHCRLLGEIGLDGSPQHRSSYYQQQEVFGRVLDAAQRHGGRVATIHSRRASRDVINAIEARTDPSRVLCLLHWFSGSSADIRRAVSAGCYFSVNSAMLNHDRGRALVQNLPQERVLTESDSPFVEINNRKSVPWDVLDTQRLLAALHGKSAEDLKQPLTDNARRVMRFAGIEV